MRLKSDSPHEASATYRRLLEAAGEIFAERGYRNATVREICRKAHANVAAVHYHFGDKEELYAAVLKHWAEIALQKYPPHLGLPDSAPPDKRLHAFIRSFLCRLTDEGRPAWHGKVMAREMVEPTKALDHLIADVIRPLRDRLLGIVRELLGKGARAAEVRLCAHSVIGQCMFYHHARHVVARLDGVAGVSPADIDRLSEHITQFSLAGIKELRR